MSGLTVRLDLEREEVYFEADDDLADVGDDVAFLTDRIIAQARETRRAAQAKERRIENLRRQNEQATIKICTVSSSVEYRLSRGARLHDVVLDFAIRNHKNPAYFVVVFAGRLVKEETTMADVGASRRCSIYIQSTDHWQLEMEDGDKLLVYEPMA